MEIHIYIAFVISTVIMIAIPGPSVILTVAHSLSFGWRPALFTVAGATMGIAVQLIVAVIGLSSLLHVISEAFDVLRWGGAVYLIYLGVRQWRNADAPLDIGSSTVSGKNLFIQGLVITIPNPKSLIFIAAFLPQFIDATKPAITQFLLILPTFLLITFVITSIWALAAGNAKEFLKNRRIAGSVYRTAGGLMIIAGLGLAMARRGN